MLFLIFSSDRLTDGMPLIFNQFIHEREQSEDQWYQNTDQWKDYHLLTIARETWLQK